MALAENWRLACLGIGRQTRLKRSASAKSDSGIDIEGGTRFGSQCEVEDVYLYASGQARLL